MTFALPLRLLAGLCLAGTLTVMAAAQTTVQDIVARVDAHYESLRSIQTEFTETYSGQGITRAESGTLWLKRPGRMRWQYRQPREKLFLTDGKTAWFYVPGERQLRKSPLRKLDDLRSPFAYLLGHTKLQKEFAGLSLAPDVKPDVAGNIVLRGVPRHAAGIAQVLMEVTPAGQFARLSMLQDDGSVTQFRFSGQKENVNIPDGQFQFSPPHGVETIESDQMNQ